VNVTVKDKKIVKFTLREPFETYQAMKFVSGVENKKSCELFSNMALQGLNEIKCLFDKLNEIILCNHKDYKKGYIL